MCLRRTTAAVSTVDQLRLATCLAHSVPGVSLLLHTVHGDRFLVATHRHDAQLTPCELRIALLTPPRFGAPSVADVVARCSVAGGLVDIGGGLYQRSHPCSADERWFVTTLADAEVCALAQSCPLDIPDDAIDVVVRSDRELGAAAVGVTASLGFGCGLDEAAFWLNAACIVAELERDLFADQAWPR